MVDHDEALSCQRCGAELTRADQRVDVDGRHEHQVVNPGGYGFTIACFDSAPGCVATGETSDEASWFSGYTWQRAYCRGCSRHVGWLFRSRSHVFYGLDLARVGR
jgi:hypothetical protein